MVNYNLSSVLPLFGFSQDLGFYKYKTPLLGFFVLQLGMFVFIQWQHCLS